MCSFDKARRGRIIVESLAQLANGDFQNGFADKGSRPHGIQQLFFRNKLSRAADQIDEHQESLGSELYCLRAFPQAFVGVVEAKGIEERLLFRAHISSQTLKVGLFSAQSEGMATQVSAFVVQFHPETRLEDELADFIASVLTD